MLPVTSPTTIRADNNMTIELQPNRWKVLQYDALNGGRTLFEVGTYGETLYPADFATSRKLPVDGLPSHSVRQVLLGWSPRFAAWQLGLLFTDEFAAQRDNRWLELARWYDPDGSLHSLTANRAGSALARVMNLPFKVVAPRLEEQAAPSKPPKPLPVLPLNMGDWLIEQDDDGLVLERRRSWATARIRRIFWYGFWVLAYTLVSVLSLTVKLGLPNAGTLLPVPHLLPYMGLGVVVVLLYLVFKNVRELLITPNRVHISQTQHELTAFRGDSAVFVTPGRKVAGVYVSEVAQQRKMKRLLQHIEINLMAVDGSFTHVLASENEHEVMVEADLRRDGAVTPLTPDEVQTPAQAAALYIAQALGDVPSYLDQRLG